MLALCIVRRNAFRRMPGSRPEGGATLLECLLVATCRRIVPTPLPLPAISAGRYPIDRYTLRNRYFLRPRLAMMA